VRALFTLNGRPAAWDVEPRTTLLDALREDTGLTGTHGGCEHGVCGACSVLVDGRAVRSCLMLAVQANGRQVVTIEGIASGSRLHPVQQALADHHGLQCGFCTPGMVIGIIDLLESERVGPSSTREEVAEALAGHLCRCTGYTGIVAAVESLAHEGVGGPGSPRPRTLR
jgi:aerobic carbon-monoxide dehydrogenase small subunit